MTSKEPLEPGVHYGGRRYSPCTSCRAGLEDSLVPSFPRLPQRWPDRHEEPNPRADQTAGETHLGWKQPALRDADGRPRKCDRLPRRSIPSSGVGRGLGVRALHLGFRIVETCARRVSATRRRQRPARPAIQDETSPLQQLRAQELPFRRPGYTIEMVWEQGAETDTGFVATSVMRVTREGLDRYRPAAWTMAVVTQGTRVENVARFCKSVREQDPEQEHEILVHGQPHPSYEEYGVRYIDTVADSPDGVTLGRKKNTIAQAARHPNLLIAHDRYVIDRGFFDGFARFGYHSISARCLRPTKMGKPTLPIAPSTRPASCGRRRCTAPTTTFSTPTSTSTAD